MSDYDRYIIIKAQNDNINTELKEQYATNKSKTLYTSQKIYELSHFNFILFVLYYICVGILLLYFFLFNKTNFSFAIKMIIIILCVIYPFLIQWIELYIYFIYSYIYSFVSGIAYVIPM